jgi:carotenoid cleavage dioxygenase-like enzyme
MTLASVYPRRFCWLAASSTPVSHFPYQSVVKVDVSRRQTAEWNAPDGCFVGEPLYVGRRQPAHAADAAENGIHAGASGQAHNGSSGQHQGPTTAPEEDDGYVVTLMHDARRGRSSLVILDARDPAAGPLAQLHLRRALPFAFHCLWSSQYHGPC